MTVDRRQLLLPDSIRETLPALYSQEELGLMALARVKFFTPDSNWTWFASEGSPVDANGYYDTDQPKVDFLLFGLVVGFEAELGYFSLNELAAQKSPLGMPIERDLYFKPGSLQSLMSLYSNSDNSQ